MIVYFSVANPELLTPKNDEVFKLMATGHLVQVKQILDEYGAENNTGMALGRTGIVQTLLNLNDRKNRNLLHYACLYNTNDVATWLFLTMQTNNVDVTQKDTMGASAVLYAARAGMVGFVLGWIKKGYDIQGSADIRGNNILHYCCGDVEELSITEIPGSRQKVAKQEDIQMIIKFLIDAKGLPKNQDKYGTNPAMYATRKGVVEVVSECIKQKNAINDVDKNGRNVLHYCWANEKIFTDLPVVRRAPCNQFKMKEIAQMLIDAGADYLAEDITGICPLQHAIQDKNIHILVYILSDTERAKRIWNEAAVELIGKLSEMKIHPRVKLPTKPVNVIGGYMHLCVRKCFTQCAMKSFKQKMEKFEETVDKAKLNVNEVDDNGMTALHHLCYYQFDSEPYGLRDGLMAKLLDLGADPKIEDLSGFTALMCAVDAGFVRDADLNDHRYDTGIGRLLRSYTSDISGECRTSLTVSEAPCVECSSLRDEIRDVKDKMKVMEERSKEFQENDHQA